MVEIELGDGSGIGRVEGGGLVEVVGADGLRRGGGTGLEVEGGLSLVSLTRMTGGLWNVWMRGVGDVVGGKRRIR
ncbi:MAG: hypothetical protein P8174_07700 [Gemmatimonadota bacterium]